MSQFTPEQMHEICDVIDTRFANQHRMAVLAALNAHGSDIVDRFFQRSGYVTQSETIRALDAVVANELRQNGDVLAEARKWIDENMHTIVQRAVTDIIVQLVGHALAGNASRIANSFLPPTFGAYSKDVADVISRVRVGMQAEMSDRGL